MYVHLRPTFDHQERQLPSAAFLFHVKPLQHGQPPAEDLHGAALIKVLKAGLFLKRRRRGARRSPKAL